MFDKGKKKEQVDGKGEPLGGLEDKEKGNKQRRFKPLRSQARQSRRTKTFTQIETSAIYGHT